MISHELVYTSEGYKIKLWSVIKENDKTQYNQSINNSPLQLVIVWMLHRDLIQDINSHITQVVSSQVYVDLDW